MKRLSYFYGSFVQDGVIPFHKVVKRMCVGKLQDDVLTFEVDNRMYKSDLWEVFSKLFEERIVSIRTLRYGREKRVVVTFETPVKMEKYLEKYVNVKES